MRPSSSSATSNVGMTSRSLGLKRPKDCTAAARTPGSLSCAACFKGKRASLACILPKASAARMRTFALSSLKAWIKAGAALSAAGPMTESAVAAAARTFTLSLPKAVVSPGTEAGPI